MATRAFLAQHGDGARDRAGEPQQDVNSHHCKKDWISGGYLNSCYVGNPFRHTDVSRILNISTTADFQKPFCCVRLPVGHKADVTAATTNVCY